MNLVTDQHNHKGIVKLFSLRLTNRLTGSKIVVNFFTPTRERKYFQEYKKWLERWDCRLKIAIDGKRKTKVASGHNWLCALLSAVEYVRVQIPEIDDRDWQDEKGVDSWAILPKTIPSSWGYPLYRRISNSSNKEEAKFIEVIEKRRLNHEAKMRGQGQRNLLMASRGTSPKPTKSTPR